MTATLTETFSPVDAMTSIGDGPAVYIGFWGLYNAGDLYGNWVKLEEANTAEKIEDCIEFLRQKFGPDNDNALEEWMIQDHQSLPKCLHGENPDLDKVEEFMTALEDIGSDNIEPYLMACDNQHQVSMLMILVIISTASTIQKRIFASNCTKIWALI